ncbi:glutathione hydrolase 1 proenzyme-like [Episyrphus balteatus]|uniref:glutathione hydrolase 1 proenzyme-like n=1 Tax=Episyrphus balteatus TaxID=286459 RepID=UPI0024858107|nr:glutathione hydrolase 1 proenzyme-like [Episyrphus balteatus]
MFIKFNKKLVIWAVIIAIVVVGIVLGLVFGLKGSSSSSVAIPKAAVVSNGKGCAAIGSSMLDDGGSAVDAAIATLLCEGIMLPHSMGLGGGFFAVIYNKTTGSIETLNARESAPLASTEGMFINKTITGAIAGAVPGELLGYWNLHQKYGKLPWKQLFPPTIELAKNGHTVSIYLHNAMKQHEQRIISEPSMAEVFVDPKTGGVWNTGDIMKRPKLAETLEIIAEKGADAIYKGGEIGKKLVEDMKKLGGIMTEEDLWKYNVTWDPPVKVDISNDYTLYTTPLPSSGSVLAMILNIVDGYDHKNDTLYWHRFIEASKHAYGQRTKLGDMHFEEGIEDIYNQIIDPKFAADIRKLILDDKTFTSYQYYGAEFANNDDHGTANMAVIDFEGNAITLTSTVNRYFGGKVRSQQTGIIINDEMDDFSTPGTVNSYDIPASPSNFIKPGKRPLSSMCPGIILDKNGNPRMLIGAAGGSMITTAVAQAILKYLVLNWDINDAIQSKRLHHQLAPMLVTYEKNFDDATLKYLERVGHELEEGSAGQFSALTTIGIKNDIPVPVYDERRVGSVSVVYPKNKMAH